MVKNHDHKIKCKYLNILFYSQSFKIVCARFRKDILIMLILGLQGSPRKRGNTSFLLSTFMDEAEKLGARTHVVEATKENIVPCKGCFYCEEHGYCVTQNDAMMPEIFPLLREADVILLASPIYFYNVTAQLKALIDRCQTLWSRIYRLNLEDPGSKTRRGFQGLACISGTTKSGTCQ